MQRLILVLRSMRVIQWINAIWLYLVIPFLIWQLILANPAQNGQVFNLLQLFLPVLPLSLGLFYLREHLEGDGCEVLYVYDRSPRIGFLLLFLLLFAVQILPIFLVLQLTGWGLWNEYGIVIFQAFALLSLFYFLVYLLRSSIMGMLGTLLYIFSVRFLVVGEWDFKIYFSSPAQLTPGRLGLLGAASILLVIWGICFERQYRGVRP